MKANRGNRMGDNASLEKNCSDVHSAHACSSVSDIILVH